MSVSSGTFGYGPESSEAMDSSLFKGPVDGLGSSEGLGRGGLVGGDRESGSWLAVVRGLFTEGSMASERLDDAELSLRLRKRSCLSGFQLLVVDSASVMSSELEETYRLPIS